MAKGGAYGTKTVVLIVGGILLVGGLIAVIVLWATGKFNKATPSAPMTISGSGVTPNLVNESLITSLDFDSLHGILTINTYNPLNEPLAFTATIHSLSNIQDVLLGINYGGNQTLTLNVQPYIMPLGRMKLGCTSGIWLEEIYVSSASTTYSPNYRRPLWQKSITQYYCMTSLT